MYDAGDERKKEVAKDRKLARGSPVGPRTASCTRGNSLKMVGMQDSLCGLPLTSILGLCKLRIAKIAESAKLHIRNCKHR